MSDPRVLDGNAVGGLLHDVFGAEVTAVPCTCGSCGARGEIARLVVYVDCPGVVVRCPECTQVLITIVRVHEHACVDLSGVSRLEL